MAKAGKPFTTPHTFSTAAEAAGFYEAERFPGVDSLPPEVVAFLDTIAEYDPEVVFNVQPAHATHYVACARPADHHPWFFAKPSGVVFQLGDKRNVEAVLDMWGTSQVDPGARPPTLETDVWFAPSELEGPAVDFCLRLAAQWAVVKVGSTHDSRDTRDLPAYTRRRADPHARG